MRLLFLGDIVGRPGRNAVIERLPGLRERWQLDCVVINGENSAGGFGITEEICDEILAAGADAITLGNHSWDQREALVFIERQPRLLRPANYPPGTPGRGADVIDTRPAAASWSSTSWAACSWTRSTIPSPPSTGSSRPARWARWPMRSSSTSMPRRRARSRPWAIIFDGRASLVVGTHTHVPTADHRILPGGTAYMTDAGMCGDYDSVLGMQKEESIRRFLQKTPGPRMEPALGEGTLSGIAVETDDRTGLAKRVAALRLGPNLEETWPRFWD